MTDWAGADNELWKETLQVLVALGNLVREDPIWAHNYNVFSALTPTQRYRWWERAKKQAAFGAPAMQTLLLKVIELRLTK